MDVLRLIDEIEDIVEAASTVPFSGKAMVDKFEVLEIIKEIRIKLPDEIKQASWIKDERQRILAEAQKDAETLLNETDNKIKNLIDHEEITKKANMKAEEIVSKAQSNAKDIRLGALEYADTILEDTQSNLKRLIDMLEDNRNDLGGPKE